MNTPSEVLATVTEKVLDKPIIHYSSLSISLSEIMIVGIVLVAAYFCHILFKLFMALQVRRNRIKLAQSRTLSQLVGYIIAFFAVTISFSSVGYSLTYFLLGSTALLVGLGFGLQQLFVDLISGIILLLDKNINYGDIVRVDIPGVSPGMVGKITLIGLRATILETVDNERVLVPNSKLLSNNLRSLMKGRGSVRYRVQIPVSFEEDFNLISGLVIQAVSTNPKIDKTPAPVIMIKNFTDNHIEMEVCFWMKELFASEVILSEVRLEILRLLRENNLTILHPQVVHSYEKKLG